MAGEKIYVIPGLGSDGRLFDNINIPGYTLKPITWIEPHSNDTMASYAGRLLDQLDTSSPFFLIGVSFGSMLSVEIAKIKPPIKLIIISGAKSSREIPWYVRAMRFIPMHRVLTPNALVLLSLTLKWFVGVRKRWDMSLFVNMVKSIPPAYMKRFTHFIVTWRSATAPENVIHLHGTRDKVLPLMYIRDAHIIKRGTHYMVYQ